MMMMWTTFGVIVIQISCSRFPKNVVTALENSILYPIKSHTHGVFDSFS